MPVYGLTNDGFLPKTLTVIRDDINKAIQTAFSILPGDKTILGQLVGIIAALFAELWEQLEAVYSAQDPTKATGAALDAVSAITGTKRPLAAYSGVTLTLFGAPGSAVAAGTKFHATSSSKQFASASAVTIAAVPAWAASTAYNIGDRVFADTDRIYECTVAGTSHASTPVSGTGGDIIDGTVHWKMIMDDIAAGGAVDVTAIATETGAITAVAGDIVSIDTAVSGLEKVTNLEDATPGRDRATDEELRTLREQELGGAGQSTADAIRAAVLRISGVKSCTVFENPTDVTDADGMPPHSVEVMVQTTWAAGDPSDQLIFDAIQENIAAGIVSTGSTSGTALDEEGVSKTVKFSRPTTKVIYVKLNLLVDPSEFPEDGTDQAAAEVVEWGDAQLTGKDVVARAIGSRAFRVDGVLDCETFIDVAPAPTLSATIAVSKREIADFDTSRITFTVTEGVP